MITRVSITFLGLGIALGVCVGSAGAKTPIGGLPATTKAHVATWALDDGCNGGTGASTGLVRRWLTFAEANCGTRSSKARADCHTRRRSYCDVMQYLDTGWEFSDGSAPLASTSSEDVNWWLHEPAPNQGARIYTSGSGGGYLINQFNQSVRSYFRSYVRRFFNADDGLMMDWQSASLSQELYYSTCGCSTTSEIRSNGALREAHQKMSEAMKHKDGAPFIQADNTLPPNPFLPQGLGMLNRRLGVDGWIVEGEPESDGTLDPYYSTLLDQMAYIVTKTKGFIVPMSRAPEGAPYQAQSRRVQEATIMLGYRPGHVVDWADFEQGSGDLAVWPEEGIYPTQPVQSLGRPGGHGCLKGTGIVCSRGGHNSLQIAPGVYRREFRSCYNDGVRFGPCAAIVNTNATLVDVHPNWLRGAYSHEITFNGGDVQSGGTVNLDGAAFSSSTTAVPADDAVLLTP